MTTWSISEFFIVLFQSSTIHSFSSSLSVIVPLIDCGSTRFWASARTFLGFGCETLLIDDAQNSEHRPSVCNQKIHGNRMTRLPSVHFIGSSWKESMHHRFHGTMTNAQPFLIHCSSRSSNHASSLSTDDGVGFAAGCCANGLDGRLIVPGFGIGADNEIINMVSSQVRFWQQPIVSAHSHLLQVWMVDSQ